MATIKVYQGDSFGKDYYSDQVPDFSVPTWTGSWAINAALGDGIALASGPLEVSTDHLSMQLRILPGDNEVLEPGAYVLTVEISNADIGFKKEVEHSKYIIMTQGI